MSYIAYKGNDRNIGGLCDRLKGLYSCYNLAKALNKDFCFLLSHMHVLKATSEPPRIQGKLLHVIDYPAFQLFQDRLNKLDFDDNESYIIQTNFDFPKYCKPLRLISFSRVMHDLFDIEGFEKENNIQKYDAGIHIRCGGGLVEWDDYNFGVDSDKDDLLARVKKVCEQHESVYLCSDSLEVLQGALSANIPNLTVPIIEPVHVDRSPEYEDEDVKNVFIDFLTIANCDTIYYTLGEFAKTAARMYLKELRQL